MRFICALTKLKLRQGTRRLRDTLARAVNAHIQPGNVLALNQPRSQAALFFVRCTSR